MSDRYLDNFDRDSVPRFPSEQARLLDHISWWDGPINGSVQFGDQRYYYDAYYLDDEKLGYQYALLRVSPEEWKSYDAWRAEAKVLGDKHRPNFHTPEAEAESDALAKKDPTLAWKTKDRIVGWFSEAGTAGQQFASIQVTNEKGELL